MGFVNMSEYSENNLPVAGTASEYMVCENIGSYHPFDVSGAIGVVNSACDTVVDNANRYCNDLKSKVSSLGDAWGKNFISVNGESISIVIPEQFEDDYSNITGHIEEQVNRCNTIITDICSRLESVNAYVQTLEDNLTRFNELRNKKSMLEASISSCEQSINNASAAAQGNSGLIASLQSEMSDYESQLSAVNTDLSFYSMIPEPDGQWIVG